MIYILVGIPLLPLLVFVYLLWRIGRTPVAPGTVRAPEGGSVLLCLGDSITHGNLGANWVASLRQRFAPVGRLVVNGGINGHMVWNVAERLDRALECTPDMVVLLIGTNDVMAAQRLDRAAMYKTQNTLPRMPDLDWSIAELGALASRLDVAVPHVAVCTIPPLGDDGEHEIAALVSRYNDAVRELATTYGWVLLDVHEALLPLLGPEKRPYVGAPKAVLALITRTAASHYLLGRSWDSIAQSKGFGATADGIHLTDTAAARVGELVTSFVQQVEDGSPAHRFPH